MIETTITPRIADVGGFTVERVLPSRVKRSVGPFVFLDRMGPASLDPGRGMDVLPHPHIGLAAVTYLFDGEIVHRDSIGSRQAITAGAINWMTAGSGIAHSERTPLEVRQRASRVDGIQLWVALPHEHEESAPGFEHHPAETMPSIDEDGVRIRLLAGSTRGASAPARTLSPLFYMEAKVPAGKSLPLPDDHEERAAYVINGLVSCGADRIDLGRMAVFARGTHPTLHAETDALIMLLGGTPLGARHMWWNFVSSSPDRIEQAKSDWLNQRFAKVAGDENEFVALPSRS